MRGILFIMIECIFTIDYEIFGSGEGSLRELVYEPTERLREIFSKSQARFVTFVEAAEIEMIEAQGSDPAIDLVKRQIRDLYNDGFEIGLHLHPQWYNARHENGRWKLDYDDYNLCTLPGERIAQIINRAITYLRRVLGKPDYAPFSFRAGNWLFQPTQPAAGILAECGVRVDSSVFKGGMRHQHGLDYRKALKNGLYWKFAERVDVPAKEGIMLEIPIYTQMVPFWQMLTTKRMGMERKGTATDQSGSRQLMRIMDFLRFRHPLKLDFCRMTINELSEMLGIALQEDRNDPATFKPIVAIGHTKELVDFETVDAFMFYLQQVNVSVSTFEGAYKKCA
jgi:hypothetical protein